MATRGWRYEKIYYIMVFKDTSMIHEIYYNTAYSFVLKKTLKANFSVALKKKTC